MVDEASNKMEACAAVMQLAMMEGFFNEEKNTYDLESFKVALGEVMRMKEVEALVSERMGQMRE